VSPGTKEKPLARAHCGCGSRPSPIGTTWPTLPSPTTMAMVTETLAGPVFRRIWTPPPPANPPAGWTPIHVAGHAALDAGSIARIVKTRGAAAGFDRRALGGTVSSAVP
jgi:hypothetical protein